MENYGDFREYTLVDGRGLEVNGFGQFQNQIIVYWDLFDKALNDFGNEIKKLNQNEFKKEIDFIRTKLKFIKRTLNLMLNNCHASKVVDCAINSRFAAEQINNDNVAWLEMVAKICSTIKEKDYLIEVSKNLCSLLDEIASQMIEFSNRCKIIKSSKKRKT